MPRRFAAARVWAATEDWLIPALRLTTHERALYYHLLRRTHLDGRRTVRFSRRQAARVTGLASATARHYLRELARKRCIRFLERGPRGAVIEVRLPAEIAARSTARARRLLAARRDARDAAGQPRAWPRSYRSPGADLRARILRRDRGRCFYCRRRLRRDWVLDHVVALARGGSHRSGNLVACCAACNWAKGLAPAAKFLRALAARGALSPAQLRSRLRAIKSSDE